MREMTRILGESDIPWILQFGECWCLLLAFASTFRRSFHLTVCLPLFLWLWRHACRLFDSPSFRICLRGILRSIRSTNRLLFFDKGT